MDDVTVALRRVRELREAGTLAADRSGLLDGLLGRLENRDHLEDLVVGLPNADAVVERVETFLTFKYPVERSDEELVGFALAFVREMLADAKVSAMPPLVKAPVVIEALESLIAAPVTVVSGSAPVSYTHLTLPTKA